MSHYYNEIDPQAVARLRNLMAEGLIPAGDIDTRSIEDVRPSDLAGYVQCHFFAGIGGWPLALALAGWDDSRPVWSGSCPCQPFSQAGKGAGFDDQRHLWPAFYHLISQCLPAVVFGEQVASKNADPWIDLVHADMENVDYAFGCVPFPAAGIGTPHIRDRNYWVADANDARLEGRRLPAESAAERLAWSSGVVSRLVHSRSDDDAAQTATAGSWQQETNGPADFSGRSGVLFGRLANTNGITGEQGRALDGWSDTRSDARTWPRLGGGGVAHDQRPGPVNGHWRDADWISCTDGKWRPVEPGTFPLAHGLPAGMGKLSPRLQELAALAGLDARSLKEAKAYRRVELHGQGNAIVPQAAAHFIASYMEARALAADMFAEAA
jgi:DNA (cytosine-5)-methyltransferase 1